ncbi:hypothetical protein CDAR_589211 [Caerostris darwini]|uniref:Uncharacterized protein n=1 Tax=Caerostris darwini TaxID=1538125 RepID=A0AAV4T9P8_9ARAC|nr:hypothetical protein CDAR_589211 [Caerostris darwini]
MQLPPRQDAGAAPVRTPPYRDMPIACKFSPLRPNCAPSSAPRRLGANSIGASAQSPRRHGVQESLTTFLDAPLVMRYRAPRKSMRACASGLPSQLPFAPFSTKLKTVLRRGLHRHTGAVCFQVVQES